MNASSLNSAMYSSSLSHQPVHGLPSCSTQHVHVQLQSSHPAAPNMCICNCSQVTDHNLAALELDTGEWADAS